MQGIGVFTYSNGDKYDGEWIEGNRNGKGIFISNADKYSGYWKDGKKMEKVLLRIKMGINMLENGRMTKCMVKEHSRIM